MATNNKKLGNTFENEFCEMMFMLNFWVHNLAQNKSGQPADVIAVKEKSQKSPKFKEIKDMSITVPSWMSVDVDKLEGKIIAMPRREDIDTPIAEHLIVELYSK